MFQGRNTLLSFDGRNTLLSFDRHNRQYSKAAISFVAAFHCCGRLECYDSCCVPRHGSVHRKKVRVMSIERKKRIVSIERNKRVVLIMYCHVLMNDVLGML